MTFVLGLTGGIGSGKSAATDQFASHGIEIVDADVIAREVVEPGQPALAAIADHFGPNILLENGGLDRGQLRQLIFSDPAEKDWLENCLHPLIRETIQAKLAEAKPPYVILSAPLLLENNLQTLTDRVLIIDCPVDTQISRVLSRDGSNRETIEQIIQQQISREERLARGDDIIDNNGTLLALQQAVDHYHSKLLKTLV